MWFEYGLLKCTGTKPVPNGAIAKKVIKKGVKILQVARVNGQLASEKPRII
ncbi:hypothetical protein BH10PLA2_BH10PLA2_08930 [soil metagenome]